MRRLLVLYVIASAAVLHAQPRAGGPPPRRGGASVAQPEPVKPEDMGTIEGTVVDASTGQPLDKAHVMLFRQQSQGGRPIGATTNSAGQFVVDNVEPGTYRISAQRNRYARGNFPGLGGDQSSPPPVSVAPKQHIKDVVIRLTPAGVITGRVTDEDGEPLPYANVTLMQFRYARGKRQLAPVSGGPSTNDLGEYRIFGLNPGRYYVRVSVPDRGEMSGTAPDRSANPSEMSYAALFYPGVSDPVQAQLVTVRAGEQIPGIDFRMTRTRAIRISGRVINPTGTAARDVMVNISPVGSSYDFLARRMNSADRQTGRFVLSGIPPGNYILSAFSRPGADSLYARAEIQAGSANIEGLDLTLAPGAVINGVLRVTGDSPSPVSLEEIRVFLQGREEANMMFGSSQATLKADGTFELRNVAPYQYRVSVFRAPEDAYLKGARFGEIDVLEKGLQVEPGSGGTLELTVHLQGGRVEGAVLDEKKAPAPGSTVVLVPVQRTHEDLYKTATADQYGRFTLRGLRPGEYKVFAWTKVETGSWLDPAFLEPVEDRGKKVTVKENDVQGVELDAIPNPENPAN